MQLAENAPAFRSALSWQQALEAHVQALQWQEALTLAMSKQDGLGHDRQTSEVQTLAQELITSLSQDKRYVEAARISLDYTRDIGSAVKILCKGIELLEAKRLVSPVNPKCTTQVSFFQVALHTTTCPELPKLLEEGAEDLCETIEADIQEMDDQLSKQLSRLKELRSIYQNSPGQCDSSHSKAKVHLAFQTNTCCATYLKTTTQL